jgi:hypothetical protein
MKVAQDIGTQIDWKFGLITRSVYRVSEDCFEIDDTSCGWTTAIVDENTMYGLMCGDIDILSIPFEG